MVLFAQESASKEGALDTQGVWGAHDEGTAGRAMARWIDAVLEEAENCRAIVGCLLLDDHASVEFWRLY